MEILTKDTIKIQVWAWPFLLELFCSITMIDYNQSIKKKIFNLTLWLFRNLCSYSTLVTYNKTFIKHFPTFAYNELYKWLSVRLWTKWLWVRIPLQSLNKSNSLSLSHSLTETPREKCQNTVFPLISAPGVNFETVRSGAY